MADDRINLGLNTGDSAQQAQSLASNLGKVRDAAQGVADTYELVAAAESKTGRSSFFEALGKADVGLAPLQNVVKSTTEFQDSLNRLDVVLKRVDDSETVFVTTAEDVARAQQRQADATERAQKAAAAQAIAVAYASATIQQEYEDAADKAVAAAVRQTQAQAAMRAVTADLPNAFQRTIGVVKSTGDQIDATGKKFGGLGGAMLTTSYAVQDFTSVIGTQGLGRALGSIQNNIPGLLMGLGAGAGLTGVVSVLSVGVGMLVDNWDNLGNLWSDTTPKLPVLKDGLEGLTESLKGINEEIKGLSEKSLTDALSHPEQMRLGALEALKTEAENRQADLKLVEGIARIQSDRTKALVEAVRKAIGEAGGGEAVAMNLKENIGGTYQDAAAIVAQAIRGDQDALKNLQRNAPTFQGKLQDDALNGMAERAGKVFAKFIDEAGQKLQKDAESAAKNIQKWHESFIDGLDAINKENRKRLEDEQAAVQEDARKTPGQDIIRNIESKDFYRTNVDKYGRETTTPGLGMSSAQVKEAATAAREFQMNGGYDDRTAAQLAIQEVMIRNQQAQADRTQQVDERVRRLIGEAERVPSLLQWGSGW